MKALLFIKSVPALLQYVKTGSARIDNLHISLHCVLLVK